MTAGDAAPAVPGRHAPRPLHGRPGLHDARPPAHPPRRRQQRVRPHILHVITWHVAIIVIMFIFVFLRKEH